MTLLNEMLRRLPSSRGSIETYEDGQWRRRSFDEVNRDVLGVVERLRRLGLSDGDRVGICGPNSYAWAVLDLACLFMGCMTVPYESDEERDCDTLRWSDDLSLLVSHIHHGSVACQVLAFDRVLALDMLMPHDQEPQHYRPTDVVTVKFTSGSTGASKAIEPMVRSIDASIAAVQEMYRHGSLDRILVFLPLSLLQQRYWIYSAILFDYCVIVTSSPFALHVAQSRHPTVVMGVPGFFEEVRAAYELMLATSRMLQFRHSVYIAAQKWLPPLRHLGFSPFKQMLGGRIRYLWTGSAPCTYETISLFHRLGLELFQGYGMTETCIVSKNHARANRLGSAGRVLGHKRVTFAPDGELLVHSAVGLNSGYSVCAPGENERTFSSDGTVNTGDLGYLDADGYLFITGRKKNLIALADGRKVNPLPIEVSLSQTTGLAHCVVVGDGRPFIGALLFDPQGRSRETFQEAVAAVNATTSSPEQVVRFAIVACTPCVENGLLSGQFKIRRSEVLRLFAPQIDALYT